MPRGMYLRGLFCPGGDRFELPSTPVLAIWPMQDAADFQGLRRTANTSMIMKEERKVVGPGRPRGCAQNKSAEMTASKIDKTSTRQNHCPSVAEDLHGYGQAILEHSNMERVRLQWTCYGVRENHCQGQPRVEGRSRQE